MVEFENGISGGVRSSKIIQIPSNYYIKSVEKFKSWLHEFNYVWKPTKTRRNMQKVVRKTYGMHVNLS